MHGKESIFSLAGSRKRSKILWLICIIALAQILHLQCRSTPTIIARPLRSLVEAFLTFSPSNNLPLTALVRRVFGGVACSLCITVVNRVASAHLGLTLRLGTIQGSCGRLSEGGREVAQPSQVTSGSHLQRFPPHSQRCCWYYVLISVGAVRPEQLHLVLLMVWDVSE